MDHPKITIVKAEHIERGIQKYDGRLDSHLSVIIQKAKLNYTPYVFKDGRILLVLPNNISGILYPNKQALFDMLSLVD